MIGKGWKDEAVLWESTASSQKPVFLNELRDSDPTFSSKKCNRGIRTGRLGQRNRNCILGRREDIELKTGDNRRTTRKPRRQVDTARNGKEALDAYLNSSPGYYRLILMDVHMPEMNGLGRAIGAVRSGRPTATVPVIAMTADVFKEDIRRCREAGMGCA